MNTMAHVKENSKLKFLFLLLACGLVLQGCGGHEQPQVNYVLPPPYYQELDQNQMYDDRKLYDRTGELEKQVKTLTEKFDKLQTDFQEIQERTRNVCVIPQGNSKVVRPCDALE